MITGPITKQRMEGWRCASPETPGLHEVISPEKSDCQQASVLRLNLPKGETYCLSSNELEMNAACVNGCAAVSCKSFNEICDKLDSFYINRQTEVIITAKEDCIFYIGAAIDEGHGAPFFRKFDLTMPLGNIHQIHGSGVGQREVFMTLCPQDAASRLICGLTWGGNGGWTSWPPHQHEQDLEEVYCYFDIEKPHFGLHLSYVESGDIDSIVAHPVSTGTMVLAPRGYHPTVASPGIQNAYFWVLAAHSHKSRRYDLAVLDPAMETFN